MPKSSGSSKAPIRDARRSGYQPFQRPSPTRRQRRSEVLPCHWPKSGRSLGHCESCSRNSSPARVAQRRLPSSVRWRFKRNLKPEAIRQTFMIPFGRAPIKRTTPTNKRPSAPAELDEGNLLDAIASVAAGSANGIGGMREKALVVKFERSPDRSLHLA